MSGYKVYSGGNDVNAVAWYYENSEKATHPVGTKAANELGIHDMSGNVWEWCRDGCILGKAGMITDTYVNGVTDPYFKTGSYRVCRGGSWNSLVQGCRVAYRNRRAFSDRYGNFGFRVALAPVQ